VVISKPAKNLGLGWERNLAIKLLRLAGAVVYPVKLNYLEGELGAKTIYISKNIHNP
jgi:hypothetical protein